MMKFAVIYLALAQIDPVAAFVSPGRRLSAARGLTTELAGVKDIIGRFRKKKHLDIPRTISIGDALPNVDVEIVKSASDGSVESSPMAIAEVLGSGTALLIGMPGAFTKTCTTLHLPGYMQAAPQLTKLGVDTIAVVTTNDRFVNNEFAKTMGIIDETTESGSKIIMVG
jgi:hypothetical protein